MTEHDKLHRAIAALEDRQRSFGLDLTQQIAELRQRMAEVEPLPRAARAQRPPLAGRLRERVASLWVDTSLAISTTHISPRQDLWHCRKNTLRGSCRPIARKLDDCEVLLLTTQEHTSVWRENAWQVGTPGSAGGGMPGVSLLGLKSGVVFPILRAQ